MLSHKKPDSVINVKVEFSEGKVPLDNIAKEPKRTSRKSELHTGRLSGKACQKDQQADSLGNTRGDRRALCSHLEGVDQEPAAKNIAYRCNNDYHAHQSGRIVIAAIVLQSDRQTRGDDKMEYGVLVSEKLNGLLVADRCFSSSEKASQEANWIPHCIA